MLKQRIMTAVILIPVFILFVLMTSPIGFCVVTGMLLILGAYEWSGLMGVKKFPYVLLYPLLMAFVLYGSINLPVPLIMYVSFAFWILATLLIVIYPKSEACWGSGVFFRAVMGIFVLMPSWLAINFIRNTQGAYALLFLFVLIWGADSAAYFAGKQWGKHKLARNVSPGKTWEGLFGALLMTVFISLIALFTSKTPYAIWPCAVVLTLVTVIFSVIGDLFESMLKRKEGLKDSGFLIPGHGGVLDRIDSITAAAPIFVVGSLLLGKMYH